MKTTTLKEVIYECVGEPEWKDNFEPKRQIILRKFPFSILVEGSLDELGTAVNWCLDTISERNDVLRESEKYDFYYSRLLKRNSPNGLWAELWYEKLGYDYGVSEFFFQNEKDLNSFILKVPDFYGIGEDGNKWRTDGMDKYEKVKE